MARNERLMQVKLYDVEPLPHLLRRKVDEVELQALAISIKERGLINPVTMRPLDGRYQLIAGYRRWLAHQWLGRPTILARVGDYTDAEIYSLAAVENLHRTDLDPLEEAQALVTMMQLHGKTVKEISKEIAKSEPWIRGRLASLTWPEDFLEILSDKKLSYGALEALVEVDDPEYRTFLLRTAVQNGVTISVAKGWVEAWKSSHVVYEKETVPLLGPHIERPPVTILLPCWGCGVEYAPVKISYKPLCNDCVAKVSG